MSPNEALRIAEHRRGIDVQHTLLSVLTLAHEQAMKLQTTSAAAAAHMAGDEWAMLRTLRADALVIVGFLNCALAHEPAAERAADQPESLSAKEAA